MIKIKTWVQDNQVCLLVVPGYNPDEKYAARGLGRMATHFSLITWEDE